MGDILYMGLKVQKCTPYTGVISNCERLQMEKLFVSICSTTLKTLLQLYAFTCYPQFDALTVFNLFGTSGIEKFILFVMIHIVIFNNNLRKIGIWKVIYKNLITQTFKALYISARI